MNKWIRLSIACLVSVLVMGSVAVRAEMPAKAQTCVACHGSQGVSSNPQWPNLAGQYAGYLADQIRAFRDGKRESAVMMPFVSNLTDNDIDSLAEYYAGQALPTPANGDSSLVQTGEALAAYCMACHGMQGLPAALVWPVLAGQNAAYLQSQMAMFKSGQRVNSAMAAVLAPLSEKEFAALAAYYSQLQP